MSSEPKKILVVDENQVFLMYVSILLKRMGFEIIPTDNGAEALKIFGRFAPDLVILDARLSEPDPVEIARSIKEASRTSHVPVIMVAAMNEDMLRKQCEDGGCDGYLLKPIRIEVLHDILQDCIFSPSGWRRRYLRAPYERKVRLIHENAEEELYAESLSERGIYLRKRRPLEVGKPVDVVIPLDDESGLSLKGTVIYIRGLFGDVFKVPPGMAVEFKDLTEATTKQLNGYVKRIVAGDIIESQEESVISME